MTCQIWFSFPWSRAVIYALLLFLAPAGVGAGDLVLTGTIYEKKTSSKMEFLPVHGGEFSMGCGSWLSGCSVNEKPAHNVRLNAFEMGKYEVTQGQWRTVMGSDPPELYFKGCGLNCPVERVSWDDVRVFIAKVNEHAKDGCLYRLPTEAEWEYACRSGGKEEKFCGGNDIGSVAWYSKNSGEKIHPVGQKKPNGFQLYDMSGNVGEMVSDWYGDDYYADSPEDNPAGPSKGFYRSFRGGAYGSSEVARSTYRTLISGVKGPDLGFRLARNCL